MNLRIDANCQARSIPTGAKLGNGVCFSPDDSWLYFSDTRRRAIFRYPTAEFADQPLAGALLAFEVGIMGQVQSRFMPLAQRASP